MKSYGTGISVAKNQYRLLPDCNYISDIAKTQKKSQVKILFSEAVSDYINNK